MRENHEKRNGKAGVKNVLALPLLASGILAALPQIASAQAYYQANILPGTVAETGIGNKAGYRSHFDIFVGNGKPGPYTLSWNNLRITKDEPFVAVLDGQTLKPEQFVVDPKKGVITFKQALKSTNVVRVSYYYDPKVSARNSGVASAPISLPVMKVAGADVQVTALPKNDANKTGFAAPLAFGTGKNLKVAGLGLTTKFNYGGQDALGMQLGYNYGNSRNGFDGTFYRADKGLITRFGNNLGYTDAANRWNLNSRLTPAKWMGFTFASNEGTDLVKNTRRGQNAMTFRLGGVDKMPAIGVSRTEDIAADVKRNETSVTTDKVDMSLKVSPSTNFAVSNTRVTTDVPTDKGDVVVEDRSFVITSNSLNNQTQASLSFTGGLKETSGAMEDRNGFAFRLQAAPVFIISAEKRDMVITPLKPDGTEGTSVTTTTQTIGAEIVPMPGTKVSGMVMETATNDIPVSATVVTAQVGMGKPLEFSTGVTNRTSEADGPEPLDTTRAQFSYRASKGMTLTGGITWNPEHQGQVSRAQRREFGLQYRMGAWEVGSGYMLTTLNGVPQWDEQDPQFGQFSLNIGLRVSRFSRLTGVYTDSLRYRSAGLLPANLVPAYTRVMGFALTHETGPGFNLTFGTTMTENRANVKQPRDKKVEGKVGVRF